MNQKLRFPLRMAICIIAALCVIVGCRLNPGNGTIYYEAKSAAAVAALLARIDPLRAALRGNTNFTEVTGRETLMFTGTTNGPFANCFIRFDRDENDVAKDDQAVLVVSTARTFKTSKQVHELRNLVEQSLGPDVVRQLTVNFDEGLIDMR
jgi:hypothetical protein